MDWNKAQTGFVLVSVDDRKQEKIVVTETGPNTGLFTTKYTVPKGSKLTVAYGYFGIEKKIDVSID